MKIKIHLLLLLSFLMIKAYSQTGLVKTDNTLRQFTLYKSSKIKQGSKAPLLFSFHGSGVTALEHMMYTNTNKLAEEKGFIVVYPQGIKNEWNVGFEQDYDKGTKDVEFIKVLLEKLKKKHVIDTSKIYAIGLSRGGFFAQRLAVELPEIIKGFVSVGALLPIKVKEQIFLKNQIKAMYIHGTADQIVKIEGKPNAYLSLKESISYWNSINKNNKEPKIDFINNFKDDTSITLKNYNSLVVEVKVENGGHTWPASDPFNFGFPLGKTTKEIDVNKLVYQFLFTSIK